MDRVQRLNDLLTQKAEIDRELAELKEHMKAEKAALAAHRKPRKKEA